MKPAVHMIFGPAMQTACGRHWRDVAKYWGSWSLVTCKNCLRRKP